MRFYLLAALALVACSDATGPTPIAPTLAKTCNEDSGPCSSGGGGGTVACTLEGARQDPHCAWGWLGNTMGAILGGAGCIGSRSWAACAAAWYNTTSGVARWREQPDPWYMPWWQPQVEHGGGAGNGWPPGSGGYPVPLGGI